MASIDTKTGRPKTVAMILTEIENRITVIRNEITNLDSAIACYKQRRRDLIDDLADGKELLEAISRAYPAQPQTETKEKEQV